MKKTIYLIVIIIGLGGALVMGYMYLRGGSEGVPTAEVASVDTSEASNLQILPFGKELDFKKLEQYNKNKILFPYPKVTPPEIGAGPGTMME